MGGYGAASTGFSLALKKIGDPRGEVSVSDLLLLRFTEG
jgi:hypothetical protein